MLSFCKISILPLLSDINQTLFGYVRPNVLYYYGHNLFEYVLTMFYSALAMVFFILFPSRHIGNYKNEIEMTTT
jgi:hypothetical protein